MHHLVCHENDREHDSRCMKRSTRGLTPAEERHDARGVVESARATSTVAVRGRRVSGRGSGRIPPGATAPQTEQESDRLTRAAAAGPRRALDIGARPASAAIAELDVLAPPRRPRRRAAGPRQRDPPRRRDRRARRPPQRCRGCALDQVDAGDASASTSTSSSPPPRPAAEIAALEVLAPLVRAARRCPAPPSPLPRPSLPAPPRPSSPPPASRPLRGSPVSRFQLPTLRPRAQRAVINPQPRGARSQPPRAQHDQPQCGVRPRRRRRGRIRLTGRRHGRPLARQLRVFDPGGTVLADVELPCRAASLRVGSSRLVGIPYTTARCWHRWWTSSTTRSSPSSTSPAIDCSRRAGDAPTQQSSPARRTACARCT